MEDLNDLTIYHVLGIGTCQDSIDTDYNDDNKNSYFNIDQALVAILILRFSITRNLMF